MAQYLRHSVTMVYIWVMELNQWIAELTDDTAQDIAKKAGLPKRTVQHQLNTGRMSLENIVKIAVAYSRHPLRTLIEWEIIDPAWASVPDIEAALKLASEDQLGDEVIRRMKLNPDSVGYSTADELAARRSGKSDRAIPSEWEGLAVADSSPDHPEEDTDFD